MTRAFARLACFVATLACLLAAAHLIGEAVRGERNNPFTAALAPHSHLAPFFVIPLVVAWFMPGWRWLLGYVLLNALGFLSGLALAAMPGGGDIAPLMVTLAVTSGAGAGFLAGVIGRSVGLGILHAGSSPLIAWPLQIAPAFVFAASAFAPLL